MGEMKTHQPAPDDPYFEMDDAYRWFKKRYFKVDPADLMSLSALDPPPGYADLQETRLRKSTKGPYWGSFGWYHFRIYRDGGPCTLAVVLENRRSPERIETMDGMVAWVEHPVVWRIWLYEHRQGRGWVCLDPKDDTHEVVRKVRAEIILGALR